MVQTNQPPPPVESHEVVDQQELPACTTSDESMNSTHLEVETRDDTLLSYGRGRHREKKLRFILYAISFCRTNWMDKMLGGLELNFRLIHLKWKG